MIKVICTDPVATIEPVEIIVIKMQEIVIRIIQPNTSECALEGRTGHDVDTSLSEEV